MNEILGRAEPGWGAVIDAFRQNFDAGIEIGAACTVYSDGVPVVDVWGGIADPRTGRPWDEDTVVLVFSTTKGITAICAHMLVERGLIDVDAPVARYWPEFAANGKEGVLVRWVLAHQAGVPFVDRRLTLDEVCSWDPVVSALEEQPPLWEPGTQHGYHALTFGWLIGEVIRRVSGQTPGRFIADQLATPLGLRMWMGLPDRVEPHVAHLDGSAPLDPDFQALLDEFVGPDSVFGRSITLGGALPLELVTPDGGFNARVVRAAELPAGNLVCDARSLARAYAAAIGEVDGIRLLTAETVASATVVQTEMTKPFGLPAGFEEFDIHKSLGFDAPTALAPMLGPHSFGHAGAGGSLAFADPTTGVTFAYVMNQMRNELGGPTRSQTLVDAVRRCIES